jgi:hypothetical protein
MMVMSGNPPWRRSSVAPCGALPIDGHGASTQGGFPNAVTIGW